MGLTSLSLTSAQSTLEVQESKWLILFGNEWEVRNVSLKDQFYLKAAEDV